MTDTVKDILTWLLPGGSVLSVIGFGFRQAWLKGAHDEQIKQMKKTVDTIQIKCTDHDAQLSDGAGNFRAIDAKLDNLAEGQGRIEAAIMRHIERDSK